jgi:hypothetical protein
MVPRRGDRWRARPDTTKEPSSTASSATANTGPPGVRLHPGLTRCGASGSHVDRSKRIVKRLSARRSAQRRVTSSVVGFAVAWKPD